MNLNKKLIVATIFSLIIAAGVFLRSWHFGNWLHFELDQSRDAKVVDLAVEHGIGNLPLLGPKAAGSFLRLGPAFYNFEYLSAIIFGNTPEGIAFLFLIFSCLSVPLFYFTLRRYFDEKISLMAVTGFAISIFLVMYSRFAWNPNTLPFFMLLSLYSLLKVVDEESSSRKGWWLILSAVGLAIATQLHFVAFLGLPAISGVFLLLKRPKIQAPFWLGALLVLIVFYTPMILNDIKTGGENIKEFGKMFSKKSSNEENSLPEKIVRGGEETALGYFLVLTGYGEGELPKVKLSKNFKADIICDANCKKNLPIGILATVFFLSGFIFYGLNFFARKKTSAQKDFLLLMGLWFGAALILFVPIAFDLAPRFFLLVAPLTFIFLAFILDFFEKRRMEIVAYFFLMIVLVSNGFFIYQRFFQLSRASSESFKIESDKILKERDRVTLKQQLAITDRMEQVYKQNGFPVYVNSEAFYRRAFLYHLEKREIARDDFRNTRQTVYAKGNYFLIYPYDESPKEEVRKYSQNYSLEWVENFGTLNLIRLTPLPERINSDKQIFGPEKKPTSAPGVPVRCRWNEIFGECNSSEMETDEG